MKGKILFDQTFRKLYLDVYQGVYICFGRSQSRFADVNRFPSYNFCYIGKKLFTLEFPMFLHQNVKNIGKFKGKKMFFL